MLKARACSNIALVKYWGKRDIKLNLPAVGSISVTLGDLYTETETDIAENSTIDIFKLNGENASEKETIRVSRFLDLIRKMSGKSDLKFTINSKNNFPTAAGLASSASGFAALSLAASKAAGLNLTTDQLSELARLGSGSAARSVFGGFVEMDHGQRPDGKDSVARELYPAEYWDLTILIVVTSEKKKDIGSTDGMELSRLTSPYYPAWIESSEADLAEIRSALENKDFQKVAEISEFSCLKMHALALASNPGLIYWNGITVDLMHFTRELRQKGIPAFFTIDAGPQVKIITESKYTKQIQEELKSFSKISRIITTGLGQGVRLINE